MSFMTPSTSTCSRRARAVLLSGLVALASSCGGGGDAGAPPTQPAPTPTLPTAPAAVQGTLTVRLVSPFADDGAILLEITGPAQPTELTALSAGASVHTRTSGSVTRVAVFGSLGSGALVRFAVPDVNAAAQYKAQVTEASDRTSALRTSVTEYQLTIAP